MQWKEINRIRSWEGIERGAEEDPEQGHGWIGLSTFHKGNISGENHGSRYVQESQQLDKSNVYGQQVPGIIRRSNIEYVIVYSKIAL